MKRKKIEVWGVGNPLMGDDIVGCLTVQRINEARAPHVTALDCGVTPENYIARLRRDPPDVLVIVDAAAMGTAPGEIRRIELDDVDSVIFSSHGIPLSNVLMDFQEDLDIVFIGIQPKFTQLGAEISDAVMTAGSTVARIILNEAWCELKTFAEEET
jgi:hydrogenase 3 maturation protease